jgi:hypothetical protein
VSKPMAAIYLLATAPLRDNPNPTDEEIRAADA